MASSCPAFPQSWHHEEQQRQPLCGWSACKYSKGTCSVSYLSKMVLEHLRVITQKLKMSLLIRFLEKY